MRGTKRDPEKGVTRKQKGGTSERAPLLAHITWTEEDGTAGHCSLLQVVRAVTVYTLTLAFLYILWFVGSAGSATDGLQQRSAGTRAAVAGRGKVPAALTACRRHLATACGDAAPGDACMQCAAGNPDLDPHNSDGFFCEQWDIQAFCNPGAPADPLAPIQQEESMEPENAIDFILDSFVICRMYACAIGPSYLILLRAGFTALVLAWLSILPQPIGSGEPSVPGALAVATGLLLVVRSFFSSVNILFFAPVPSFADSWYLCYEIKWYVALQHPSFGQAVSVVLHKFYGWISTELAWRRKTADYKRKQVEEKIKAAEKQAAEEAGGAEQSEHASAEADGQQRSRPKEEHSPGGGRAAEGAPPAAAASGAPAAAAEAAAQPRQGPARPPQPPAISQIIFDLAEALKTPPEAALGTAATIALQVSLSLALLNVAIVVPPLIVTHLVPAVLLLPCTVLIGIFYMDWWRSVSLTVLFSVLAAVFIITAGFVIAFLKQYAAERWVSKHEEEDSDVGETPNVISARLTSFGITGRHPHHPNMFAARAVFVKVLSLVAALVVIALQEATARVVLLRQRDSARFLLCSAAMLLVAVLSFFITRHHYSVHWSREQRMLMAFDYSLLAAAVVVCTVALAPLQRFPAEVFDARTTCAYTECAMHHFKQGIMGKINNYFEMMPFITALVHHLSPVQCFDSIDYTPPNWGAVGLVALAILLLAALGYLIKRALWPATSDADNVLVEAMMAAALDKRVRELCAEYPDVDPAFVEAVVKKHPDDRSTQGEDLLLARPRIYGAGTNSRGQLGVTPEGEYDVFGELHDMRLSPVAAAGLQPPQGAEIAEVHCGYEFVLLRTAQGDVLHAGANDYGQRGDGGMDYAPHPELSRVPLAAAAVSIAVGEIHAAAALADRSVHTWGSDNNKQLGRGGDKVRHPQAVPGISDAERVSAGVLCTFAHRRGGEVSAWGNNDAGQLCLGRAGENEATPQRVAALCGVPLLHLTGGKNHCIALRADGRALAWGKLNDRLADGSAAWTEERGCVPIVLQICPQLSVAAGYKFCGSVGRDGVLRLWGKGHALQPAAVPLPGGAAAREVVCGGNYSGYTVFARTAGGEWAAMGAGQACGLPFGSGDVVEQLRPLPETLAGCRRVVTGPTSEFALYLCAQ